MKKENYILKILFIFLGITNFAFANTNCVQEYQTVEIAPTEDCPEGYTEKITKQFYMTEKGVSWLDETQEKICERISYPLDADCKSSQLTDEEKDSLTKQFTQYKTVGEGENIKLYKSCSEIKVAHPTTKSGVFKLWQGYEVYCDMETDGGGWTLVLKDDGYSFKYNNQAWTTDNFIGETPLENVHKSKAFNEVPVKELLVKMDGGEDVVLTRDGTSALSIFKQGKVNTSLGRQTWKRMIPGSSMQGNCNQEGFNLTYSKYARIGYTTNQENNCSSNDSVIGIGLDSRNGSYPLSSGNVQLSSGGDNGTKNLIRKSELFVRDLSVSDKQKISKAQEGDLLETPKRIISEDLRSCAELKLQYNDLVSGIFTINPNGKRIPVYCDMETDGGGWTLAMNLDTSDGNYLDWTRGWRNPFDYGLPTKPFQQDYLSKTIWENLKLDSIMIKNHRNGVINATKAWKLKTALKNRTFKDLFNSEKRTILTEKHYLFDKSSQVSSDYLSKDIIMFKPGELAINWTYSNNGVRITNTGTWLSEPADNDDKTRGLGTHFCLTPYDNIAGVEASDCHWQIEASGVYDPTNSYLQNNSGIGTDNEQKGATLANRDYDYAIFIREFDGKLFEQIKKEQINNKNLTSCLDIIERDPTSKSGIYTVNPTGVKKERVYCDMTTDGGGWTLGIRLNTNDTDTRSYVNDFWQSRGEIGTIEDGNDYLSYIGMNIPMKEIKLQYNYGNGLEVSKSYTNLTSNDTLFQNYNIKASTSNKSWTEFAKLNTLSDEFFGPELKFQHIADDVYDDYSRIWYNNRQPNDCNQGGSIGHLGDRSVNNWYWEVAKSMKDGGSCQHNTYRLGLGSNYNPKSWGRTKVGTNFDQNGVMYIFVRERPPKKLNGNYPKSCTELLNKGETVSGTYVIQPKETIEPFRVYCDMTTDGGGWTKVAYNKNLDYKQQYTGGDRHNWLPNDFDTRGYFELTNEQINAIREVSTEGKQTYKHRCNGVIGHYYSTSKHYKSKMHFKMFDGKHTGTKTYESPSYNGWDIEVVNDGCQRNGGEKGSLSKTTDFEIKSLSLPVNNVDVLDGGDNGEYFGSNLTENPSWFRGNIAKEVDLKSTYIYRTCTHAYNSGHIENGLYKIQPKKTLEPFNVYCDMQNGGWTRISYNRDIKLVNQFSGGDTNRWLENDFDKMGLFELTNEQINAIREVSTEGKQTYKHDCIGSMAYKQSATGKYYYKIHFKLFDNKTTGFTSLSEDRPDYKINDFKVLSDGCAINDSTQRQTTFELNSLSLPIKNINTRDSGDLNEKFGSLLSQNPAWFRGDNYQNKLNYSCSTIKKFNPNAKSGYYTISPEGLETQVYCDMTTDEGGWTYLISNKTAISNIEQVANTLWGDGLNRVMKYEVPGVIKAYYKRETSYEANFYEDVIQTWRNTDNKFQEDFNIYSTYEDSKLGNNPWKYCNFSNEPNPEHRGVGFPRDCGPTGAQGGKWQQTDLRYSGSYGSFTSYNRAYVIAIKDESIVAPGTSSAIDAEAPKPESCLDIQHLDENAKSGIYEIYPQGSKLKVYCNMEYQGGGWTLVWNNLKNTNHLTMYKRSWSWTTQFNSYFGGDTNNISTEYLNGTPDRFESFVGFNAWNAILNNKRGQFAYVWKANNTGSIHQSFVANIDPFDSQYYLRLSSYSQKNGGTQSGVWNYHNNRRWMTYNQYNNGCANYYSYTPFWYGSCWSGNMNGGGIYSGSGYYNGAYWTSSQKYWGRTNGQGAGAGWYFIRPAEPSEAVKEYKSALTKKEDILVKYNTCLEILRDNPQATSGEYEVKDGSLSKKVYCDMETDGGGWTKIQDFTVTNGRHQTFKTTYPAKEFMAKYSDMIWYNYYGTKRHTHQIFDVFAPGKEKECYSDWHELNKGTKAYNITNSSAYSDSNRPYYYYRPACRWGTSNYEKPTGYYTNKFKEFIPAGTTIYVGDYKNVSGDSSWNTRGYTGTEKFSTFFREDSNTSLVKYKSCADIEKEGITTTGKYVINPSGEKDIVVTCDFDNGKAYIELENLVKNSGFVNGYGIPGESGSHGKNEIIKMESPISSGYVLRQSGMTEYEITKNSLKQPLKPNTTYKLGAWVAFTDDYNGSNQVLHSRWWDKNGKPYTTSGYKKITNEKIIGNVKWQYQTNIFTTPSTLNGNWSGYIGYPTHRNVNPELGYKYVVGYSLTELVEEHPDLIRDFNVNTCKELKVKDQTLPDGIYRLKGVKVYCDMTTDGGGWTGVFANVGGNINPQMSNEQLWISTNQDVVEPGKYISQKNSFVWDYFRNKPRVEVLKTQRRTDGNYDWNNIIFDLGEETTLGHITPISGLTTSRVYKDLPSKVKMYIDNNYNGETNILMQSSVSIGFANKENNDYPSNTSDDNKMNDWNARHVISYIHDTKGRDTTRCQFECYGSSPNYAREVIFMVREKDELQPLKLGKYSSGLSMYLPMDEIRGGVLDYTKKQTGNTIGTEIGDGRFGKARYFKNTNDKVDFSSFNIPGDKTMSLWIKTDRQLSTNPDFGIGFGGKSKIFGTSFKLNYGVGNTSQGQDLSFSGYGSSYDYSVKSFTNPWSSDGQWHNAIVIKDKETIKIYVNGVLQELMRHSNGSLSNEGNTLETALNTFFIGLSNDIATGTYIAVDDVAIWDKVISEDMIVNISTSNKPLLNLIAETNKDFIFNSCLDILTNDKSAKSGYYLIDGEKTYCDMETDGGGWTHVATLSDDDLDVWSQFAAPQDIGTWENDVNFGEQSFSKDYKSKLYAKINASDMLIKEGKSGERNVLKTNSSCIGNQPLNKFFKDLSWNANGSDSNWNDTLTGAKTCGYTDFGYYDPVLRAASYAEKEIAFKWGERNYEQDNNKDRSMIRTLSAYNDNGNMQVDAPVGLGAFVSYSGNEKYEDAGECRGDGPEKCGDNRHYYQLFVRELPKEDPNKNKVFLDLKSCVEIKEKFNDAPSGNYVINPTGEELISVYCDMSTDGGGWTLMMTARQVEDIGTSSSSKTTTYYPSWLNWDYYNENLEVNPYTKPTLSSMQKVFKQVPFKQIMFRDDINSATSIYEHDQVSVFTSKSGSMKKITNGDWPFGTIRIWPSGGDRNIANAISTNTIKFNDCGGSTWRPSKACVRLGIAGYDYYSFKNAVGIGLYGEEWYSERLKVNAPIGYMGHRNYKTLKGDAFIRERKPNLGLTTTSIDEDSKEVVNQEYRDLGSCREIKSKDLTTTNGVYEIKVNNEYHNVYCDMETDGGGWTMVGRSIAGNNSDWGCVNNIDNRKIGWFVSNGNVEDTTSQYSISVKDIDFSEVLFGTYKDKYTWGNYIYKTNVGRNFKNDYYNSQKNVGEPTAMLTSVSGFTMATKMGYTSELTNYSLRDTSGQGFGLFAKGWSTCYGTNDPNTENKGGYLNSKQGMIMVRDFRPEEISVLLEKIQTINDKEYTNCKEILTDNPFAQSGFYLLNDKNGRSYNIYCEMDKNNGGWIDVVKTLEKYPENFNLFFESVNVAKVEVKTNKDGKLGIVIEYDQYSSHNVPIYLNQNKSYTNNSIRISWALQGSDENYRCSGSSNWIPLNGPGYNGGYTGYQAPCKSGFNCIQGTTTVYRDEPINAKYYNTNVSSNTLLTWSGSRTDVKGTSENCARDPKIPSGMTALWIDELLLQETEIKTNSEGTYKEDNIIEWKTKDRIENPCKDGGTPDFENKKCYTYVRERAYKAVSPGTHYAYQAESYCRSISGNKMELFYPKTATELQTLVSKYGNSYFRIMGIYPKYYRASCVNKRFNSANCSTWGPKSGGEWFVSNNYKGEPNGDNHVNASMYYWWNGNGLSNLYHWNDVPSPGYRHNRYLCSSIKGQEPLVKKEYDITDEDICGDPRYIYNKDTKKCESGMALAASCKDIKQMFPSSRTGYFTLNNNEEVYCDMETDGGGWTHLNNVTIETQNGQAGYNKSNLGFTLYANSTHRSSLHYGSHVLLDSKKLLKNGYTEIAVTQLGGNVNYGCAGVVWNSTFYTGTDTLRANLDQYHYPGWSPYNSTYGAYFNFSNGTTRKVVLPTTQTKVHLGLGGYTSCSRPTHTIQVKVR